MFAPSSVRIRFSSSTLSENGSLLGVLQALHTEDLVDLVAVLTDGEGVFGGEAVLAGGGHGTLLTSGGDIQAARRRGPRAAMRGDRIGLLFRARSVPGHPTRHDRAETGLTANSTLVLFRSANRWTNQRQSRRPRTIAHPGPPWVVRAQGRGRGRSSLSVAGQLDQVLDVSRLQALQQRHEDVGERPDGADVPLPSTLTVTTPSPMSCLNSRLMMSSPCGVQLVRADRVGQVGVDGGSRPG